MPLRILRKYPQSQTATTSPSDPVRGFLFPFYQIGSPLSRIREDATLFPIGSASVSFDIADWIIRTRCKPVAEPVKEHCEAFLKAAQFVDPKYRAELEGLINDFELEFVGFEPGVVRKEPP